MTTETISIRMDWRASLPLLLTVLENGDSKGRAMARTELRRMAAIADSAVLRSERARLVRAGAKFADELAGPICDIRDVEKFSVAHNEWRDRLAKHKESVRQYWHARLALNSEMAA